MRFPLALAAVLVLAAPARAGDAPAPAAPPPMGMEAARKHAMAHSGLIEAARHGTEVFEAKLRQAEALQYPHVSASSFFAPMPAQRGNALSGYTDYSDWGVVTVTEVTGYVPLFTFFKISHLKKASALGIDVGRAQEEIARAEVRFRIQKAFFGLSLARELSSVIDEGRGYLDKARTRLDDLEKADDPSYDPVDKLKFRVYDAQVKTKTLDAERAVAVAEAAIVAVAGIDGPDRPAFVAAPPEPVKPLVELSMKDAIEQAMGSRPELLALRKGVAARTEEVAARKSAFWPDFVLVGRYKFATSNVADNQPTGFANDPYHTNSGGGGIALKLDLEIGKKLGELNEARATLAKLEADTREAERGVRLEVEKLWREMADARAQVASQKDAMEAARGWVIAKTDLYENGMSELNDVLTGVVQFFQARLDYLKAIHDYNVALAALERATGVALVPPDATAPRPAAGE